MICGDFGPEFPDLDLDVPCCMATAIGDRCTCWTAVYDLDQQPLDHAAPIVARESMCVDCAFRPDSPERNGADDVAHDQGELDALIYRGVFFCHQGMRRPVKWVHPSGAEHPASDVDYSPPSNRYRVPFKADGTPGDVCRGFLVEKIRALAERGD